MKVKLRLSPSNLGWGIIGLQAQTSTAETKLYYSRSVGSKILLVLRHKGMDTLSQITLEIAQEVKDALIKNLGSACTS